MPIGNGTILEHVISQLSAVGVSELAINLHHFPEQIKNYLSSHNNFGLTVHFSYEQALLDTGGGLKQVHDIFQHEDAFFVHNSDIYCTHDLATLLTDHRQLQAVATLGIMKRSSSRGLYFDELNRLIGWTEAPDTSPPKASLHEHPLLAFSGISVCSNQIFSYMSSGDTFSIIESFLAAAQATGRVFGSPIPTSTWADIGTPERLSAVQEALQADTTKGRN